MNCDPIDDVVYTLSGLGGFKGAGGLSDPESQNERLFALADLRCRPVYVVDGVVRSLKNCERSQITRKSDPFEETQFRERLVSMFIPLKTQRIASISDWRPSLKGLASSTSIRHHRPRAKLPE
jgi:hypothetical protein